MFDYKSFQNQFEEIQPIKAIFCRWLVGVRKMMNVELADEFIPVNVRIEGDVPTNLVEDDEITLHPILFFTGQGKIYADEATYNATKTYKLASQSFIPCGTFSPSSDKNFRQSPHVMLTGKVASVKTFIDCYGNESFALQVECMSFTFATLVAPSQVKEAPQVGNIIEGVFVFTV